MTAPTGRHRRPRGMTISTIELTIMILLGTLGVLMVLAARPFRRTT